jgi:hypothetical protein
MKLVHQVRHQVSIFPLLWRCIVESAGSSCAGRDTARLPLRSRFRAQATRPACADIQVRAGPFPVCRYFMYREERVRSGIGAHVCW